MVAGDPSAMLVLPTGHIVILPRAGKKVFDGGGGNVSFCKW